MKDGFSLRLVVVIVVSFLFFYSRNDDMHFSYYWKSREHSHDSFLEVFFNVKMKVEAHFIISIFIFISYFPITIEIW